MTTQIDPRIDHYKTLGVKREADDGEIKKAYRRLAKRYHPDSTGGDKAKEAKFKQISQAYDVLGDKDKRAQYDALRSGSGQFHNFQGGFPGGGPGGSGINLNDIFSQMFQGSGGRGSGFNMRFDSGGAPFSGGSMFEQRDRQSQKPRRKRPPTERKVKLSNGSTAMRRSNDIHADLRLSLDQAILGTVADVATLTGTGKIKIPPGTCSGARLRMKGKGATAKDGTKGHHYVTVHIDVPKNVDDKARQLLIEFMQRTKR